MALYRSVEARTWSDPWFEELSPLSKLLFLFCITNDHQTAAGAFEASAKSIRNLTGLNDEQLADCFDELRPKVTWWPGQNWIFVHRFYRRQGEHAHPINWRKSAQSALAKVPDYVRAAALAIYPELDDPTDTLPIPTATLPDQQQQQQLQLQQQPKGRAARPAKERASAPPTNVQAACYEAMVDELRSEGRATAKVMADDQVRKQCIFMADVVKIIGPDADHPAVVRRYARYLMGDPYWYGKPIHAGVMKAQIGNWLQAGMPDSPPKARSPNGRPSTLDNLKIAREMMNAARSAGSGDGGTVLDIPASSQERPGPNSPAPRHLPAGVGPTS